MAALGFQTLLQRWTFVAQQSFALWETKLKVSTKNFMKCYFILDVCLQEKEWWLKILRHVNHHTHFGKYMLSPMVLAEYKFKIPFINTWRIYIDVFGSITWPLHLSFYGSSSDPANGKTDPVVKKNQNGPPLQVALQSQPLYSSSFLCLISVGTLAF